MSNQVTITHDVLLDKEVEKKIEDADIGNVGEGGQVLETKFANLGRVATFRVFWRAVLYCTILAWATATDGFQVQLPGNIIPLPAFVAQMADTTIDGSPALSAKVTSFFQGFAEMSRTAGMIISPFIADRFGRKPAMIMACVIMLLGAVTEISSNRWQAWLGATVFVKFGCGAGQGVLVIYNSEIAPFQIRGFMLGSFQLMFAFGQMIMAITVQLVKNAQPTKWRPIIAAEFIFSGSLFILLWLVPESHLFHARKGNHEKAKHCMKRLYGYAPGYDVDYEYNVIQHGIAAELAFNALAAETKWLEIFRGVNWKRTLAGAVGLSSQWAAGAPIVFNYSTLFFQLAGLDNPFLVSIITFLLLMIFTFLALVFCESVGRRPLLVGGCFCCCLFAIGLATTAYFHTDAANKTALAMLLLWVISYGSSSGPLGFVAAGETSTPRLRAKTTAFCMMCYGIGFVTFTWSVSYMISPDAANMGVKAIYIWAGMLVPTTVLLYLYYPETAGRTYWELDELYERGVPAWKFKSTKTLAEQAGKKSRSPLGAYNPPVHA